jgi:hypothetical protein
VLHRVAQHVGKLRDEPRDRAARDARLDDQEFDRELQLRRAEPEQLRVRRQQLPDLRGVSD